jgi:hypothetical protein
MTRQDTNRRKHRNLLPLFALIAGSVLLIAALAIGLGKGVKPEPNPTMQLTSNDQVPRVSVQEAKAAFDAGGAVFVDVRSPEAYADSHIPGALNIPLGEIQARISELNPDEWIIPY